MKILETSDDKFQIQVAINLIKIVIEHNIEDNSLDFSRRYYAVQSMKEDRKRNIRDGMTLIRHLRTAIQMLENCPEDIQGKIAQEIAALVTEKFNHEEKNLKMN